MNNERNNKPANQPSLTSGEDSPQACIPQERIYAKGKKSSMKRRMANRDYKGKGIYMITITTEHRNPIFGRLQFAGDASSPFIEHSIVGKMVSDECLNIHAQWPQIDIQLVQVMPDHVHILLQVTEPLPKHLGKIIAFFMLKTTQNYNKLCGVDIEKDGSLKLWEKGYHDRIITNTEQLSAVKKYLWDNPLRLAIKRGRQELFNQVGIEVCGHFFVSIGNRELLNAKRLLQVQCSRRLTEEEILDRVKNFLDEGKQGTVLVSPCISPGEKAVASAAVDNGIPLIVLLENGFSQYFKPNGRHFNACASGKLLMLAPWEHHNERRTITREQCLQLNEMAKDLCNGQADASFI